MNFDGDLYDPISIYSLSGKFVFSGMWNHQLCTSANAELQVSDFFKDLVSENYWLFLFVCFRYVNIKEHKLDANTDAES